MKKIMIFLILGFLRRYLACHKAAPNPPSPLFLTGNPQDTPGPHFNLSKICLPFLTKYFHFIVFSDTQKFENNTKLLVGVHVLSLFFPTVKCEQKEAAPPPPSFLAAASFPLNQPTWEEAEAPAALGP